MNLPLRHMSPSTGFHSSRSHDFSSWGRSTAHAGSCRGGSCRSKAATRRMHHYPVLAALTRRQHHKDSGMASCTREHRGKQMGLQSGGDEVWVMAPPGNLSVGAARLSSEGCRGGTAVQGSSQAQLSFVSTPDVLGPGNRSRRCLLGKADPITCPSDGQRVTLIVVSEREGCPQPGSHG